MDTTFDQLFYNRGALIGGIDESGTTDIAGPLVAACVILPKVFDPKAIDLRLFEINDSKEIPERFRKKHAETIWKSALGIGIGEVTPPELDYFGINVSIRLAMVRAVVACKSPITMQPQVPSFLLIDGRKKTPQLPLSIPQEHVPDADAKSLAVASASIVAKVYRDEQMVRLNERYPGYGWDKNKGHPAPDHLTGLDHQGVVIGVHRLQSSIFVKQVHLERQELWKRTSLNKMNSLLKNEFEVLKKR